MSELIAQMQTLHSNMEKVLESNTALHKAIRQGPTPNHGPSGASGATNEQHTGAQAECSSRTIDGTATNSYGVPSKSAESAVNGEFAHLLDFLPNVKQIVQDECEPTITK